MAKITIDGNTREVADGTLILEAAMEQRIDIPTFCYMARLAPLASCRMCLVEIEGQGKLQPSCATTVADGMVVRTDTPLVAETRKSMLELLLANHPLDCPVCDKSGECELQDQVFEYGAGEARFQDQKRVFYSKDIDLNPVIIFNAQRCIQCQRCVRICEEVVGAVALGTVEKGMDTKVTGFENSLAGCDHCGNCIEVCPVGALMSTPYRYKARPWDLKETDTICPYCGTGCHLSISVRDGQLSRVRSKYETGVNGETLCVKGRFGIDFIDGDNRLRTPLVRKEGALTAVSWEEAAAFIAERADGAIEKGGSGLGGLASPRLNNESLYLFQKLMRTAFRTNSIDSSSRWSAAGPGAYQSLEGLFGGLYARRSLHQVLEADCILILGATVTDETPVTEYMVRGVARSRGTKLFIASARPSRLDSEAISSLRFVPGAEAYLLSALLNGIEGAEKTFANMGALKKSLLKAAKTPPPEFGEFLEKARTTFGAAESVTLLIGADLLRSPGASAALSMVHGLGRVLDALGKRAEVQFLFDRPNQMGAWELGVLPGLLPGWRPVGDAAVRAPFEEAWGASLPADSGADFRRMLERLEAGKMDVLYVAGSDPLLSYPDGGLVESALSKARLLIVQDAFMTGTARLADVVLPAATFAEEPGTFTNNEGKVQELRPIRRPAFESKPNAEIFALVAEALGRDLGPVSPDAVFAEIAHLVPSYRGLSRDGLGDDGSYTHPFAEENGGDLDDPPLAAPRRTKGLELVTGDSMFHSGYLSGNSPVLGNLSAKAYVEMNPDAAAGLELPDGSGVVVRSSHGEMKARLKLNKRFPAGIVFVPDNFADARLNRLLKHGEYPCLVEVKRE